MAKDAKDKTKNAATPAAAGSDGSQSPAGRRYGRYCLVLLLAGVTALAWLSVLTFSPTDAPSAIQYPPPPVSNAAGVVGAYLSYGLLYWLGKGAYMLLLLLMIAAVIMLLGGRISDWPWRLAGMVLLVVVTSAATHVRNPVSADGLLEGNGGILGVSVGQFMLSRFATTGTWLTLLVGLGVGVMLTAENLVLRLPGLGKKLWQKRSAVTLPVSLLRREDAPRRADLQNMPASPRAVAAAPARATREAEPRTSAPAPAPAPPKLPVVKAEKPQPQPQPTGAEEYDAPPTELLSESTGEYAEMQEAAVLEKRSVLQRTLDEFGVNAEVVGHMTGPVISMFELSLAPGVKVNRISALAPDIARALAVPGVRIVSPLPGRDTVGIEVPNLDKEIVRLRELMELAPDAADRMQIPLYLGKDAAGRPIVADLAAMPHLLLAGTTGSGKSVCINAIVSAILMTRPPEDVRLILVDPKMVEMAAYEKIPHLLCPIVNDMRRAEDILEWAATKMDERYELLKEAGVRNVVGYNKLSREELYERFGAENDEERSHITTHIPYYVIIVDELADLIMTSSKDVETHIIRIAQKARAVGIHLILATQRPSVNVVTGLIKSNMPCRVSFRTASRQESRIVLDQNGADVLLGHGDMLFLQPGTSHLSRAQGTFVDDSEVRALANHVSKGIRPVYEDELVKIQSGMADLDGGERDELFDQAVEIALASRRGSVSLLQRRLAIGYSRASRIVDQMAEAGILGDYKGSQARECLMTLEDWQALQASIAADQSGESALDGTPTSA